VTPDEEYVESRRVLLDALGALGRHRQAVVVAGAQALYLRAGEGSLSISAYTTDADLTLDPAKLAATPELEALFKEAGFEHIERNGSLEPGAWQIDGEVRGKAIKVPLDLIVPTGSSEGGRRSADLGNHGRRAARRTPGLEAALVDNEALPIIALDPADQRAFTARVAGLPALLIAKSYKLADRIQLNQQDRLSNKDAADVIRILQAMPAAEMGTKLISLLAHPAAGESTADGLALFNRLFGRRGAPGIQMAVQALRNAMPEATVQGMCVAYSQHLTEGISPL
jgi:hypothetical protein